MARKKKMQLTHIERPDGKIPVAGYVRVSSTGQDVENSIDAQIVHIRTWAENNGYILVKIFTDKAKTGTIAKRPDFQEMIETAERPDCPFAGVLVWRFSRFFRNREESVVYKNRLRKKGLRVISIKEPVEDSAAGQLMEGIIETLDEYNSRIIGEEVQRGTHNLAGKGFFLAANAPFGMMKEKVLDGEKWRTKLKPDPKTKHIIRRIFDLALQDKSEGQIQDTLKGEGILGPNGKPWPSKRIHDVLTNRHHEGTIVWGASSEINPPTICENAHEGIVTPEEFAKVQENLKSRAPDVINPAAAGSDKLLSQLGKCRQCGASYNYGPAGKGDKIYRYIVCTNRKENRTGTEGWCDSPNLPAELFEEFTLDVVYEDILALPKLEVAIEELRKHSGTLHNPDTRLDDIRERIAEIDQRMAQLYIAWENEDIEYEFYANRNRVLRDSKAKAQEDLNRTGSGLDDTSVILNDPQAALDHSAEVKSFLQNETPVRARAWLNSFLKRYWVEPGYVTYEYSLPMPPGSANPGLTRHRVPLDEDFRPTTRQAPQMLAEATNGIWVLEVFRRGYTHQHPPVQ